MNATLITLHVFNFKQFKSGDSELGTAIMALLFIPHLIAELIFVVLVIVAGIFSLVAIPFVSQVISLGTFYSRLHGERAGSLIKKCGIQIITKPLKTYTTKSPSKATWIKRGLPQLF